MTIPEILRNARLHKHFTIKELSVCTGIPVRTLGAYERSERDPFGASFSSFCVLCDWLDLDVVDMAYLAREQFDIKHGVPVSHHHSSIGITDEPFYYVVDQE